MSTRTGKIYKPKEIAEELKVPMRTVLRAIREGHLKMVKFSSCVFRIEGEDVDRWIESLKK
jgi:excisionase family DNA binding protein